MIIQDLSFLYKIKVQANPSLLEIDKKETKNMRLKFNPTLAYPMPTIFHHLASGLALGPRWFVLCLQWVFDTNMLVSAMPNGRIGGHAQPNMMPQREGVRVLVKYRL